MSLVEQLAGALRNGLSPEQASQLADALRQDKPTAESKATKLEANYREAGSDRSECGNCQHYSASDRGNGPGSCDIVAGSIDPAFVCDWYEPAVKRPGRQGSTPVDSGGDHHGNRRRDSLGD